MKKIIFTLTVALAFLVNVAHAAPTARLERTLYPELNDYYELGTSTPYQGSVREWLNIFTKNLTVSSLGGAGVRCVQTDNSGLVSLAVNPCGSGSGGGGGGGTWSTTTSSVPAWLINYSNNTTDIVVIGGTATSTAKFIFDPNSQRGLIPFASTTVTSATSLCLGTDCRQTWPNGIGTVSTSSIPSVGGLAYWTSAGYPSLLGTVATGTLAASGPITVTSGQSVIGSGATVACPTCVPNTITLTAGTGLTGGGDLSANRTFNVGAGTGITVNADDVALTIPVVISSGGTGLTTIGASSTVLQSNGTTLVYQKLSPGLFTTTNVSQWTNDSGYLTIATLPFAYPFPLVVGGTNGTTTIGLRFDGGIISNASSSFSAGIMFPNNIDSFTVAGDTGSNATSFKVGTDGTALWQTGTGENFKAREGCDQATCKFAVTNNAFNTDLFNVLGGTGNANLVGSLTISTSTITGLIVPYASTTALSTGYASSTLYYGANLATCATSLTWLAGQFGCNAGGAGSASTTLLIDNNTFAGLTQFTNTGTTSFTGRISTVSASTTATSTMAGINLPYGGCFAVAGVCITTSTGSGNSFAFPFTPVANGNATSTTIDFYGGITTQGSTTIPYASTTAVTIPSLYDSRGNLGASSTVLTSNGTIDFWTKLATSQLTNDSGFLTNANAVTSVATNNGLTGGTITTTGTIGLDTSAIINGLLVQYNGSRLAATGTPSLTTGYLIATSTNGLATSTFAHGVIMNGLVGIGTASPTDVNPNAKLTVASIGSTDIIASTTDNTSSSDALVRVYAPGSSIFMGAHGTNQVTTQYGLTVGGYAEISAINSTFGTSNGLMIGTRTTNTPIIFGTNSSERMRITGGGLVGIATTSPYAALSVVGASGVVADHYAATSTTATSTFANGIEIIGGGLKIDPIQNCNGNFVLETTAGVVGCGADASGSPTGIANTIATFDASGNLVSTSSLSLIVGSLIATSTASSSFTGPLILDQGAAAISICGNPWFQVGSTTCNFFVDKLSGRIGISTTSPSAQFAVGSSIFVGQTGTSTFSGNGINLPLGGCFAIAGTCLGGGSGSSSVGPVNVLQASNGSGAFIATGTQALTVGYLIGTTTGTSTFAGGINIAQGGLTVEGSTGSATTTIPNLVVGNPTFDGGAGVLNWQTMNLYDVNVANIPQVFIAGFNDDTIPLLALGGVSTGGGWLKNYGVAIGTSTINGSSLFTIQASSTAQNILQAIDFASSTKLVLSGAGKLGVGTTTPGAALAIEQSSTDNALFLVSDQGTTTPALIVGGNHSIGIGTSTPWLKMGFVGTAVWKGLNTGNTPVGYMCFDANDQLVNSGSTCTISDENKKENIKDVDTGLSMLLQMKPITYQIKPEILGQYKDDRNRAGDQFGLSAQQIGAIDERLVYLNDEGQPKSIRYDGITAVLVKAVKEMYANFWTMLQSHGERIDTLENKVMSQQGQIDQQDKAINDLRKQIESLQTLVNSQTE